MELKTPYYVINQNELDSNYNKLRGALENNWNNYIIGYSYKTNALPWVIKHFNDLGCYAEVVSDDELELAKLIGVDSKKIIYNGPIKTKESFINSLNCGSIVNIDSQREIDWLNDVDSRNCNVGIRVNFDIEKMCPGQSQCPEDGGRFGFCLENGEFRKAIQHIQSKGFKITGLHLHTSSKSRGLDIYRAIANVACELKDELKNDLLYIDIGGGFFGGLSDKPQFEEYFSMIADILKKNYTVSKTKLIVEPGMALIGSPISYVTSVIDVKDTEYNRFVVTDGTRTSIDPLMTKKSYFHSYINVHSNKKHPRQIICGYTCMEHDRLFEAINDVELQIGDQIVYEKVGAYTMCLTPLFIKYYPNVYVENNGNLEKIRCSWHAKEYTQKSKF